MFTDEVTFSNLIHVLFSYVFFLSLAQECPIRRSPVDCKGSAGRSHLGKVKSVPPDGCTRRPIWDLFLYGSRVTGHYACTSMLATAKHKQAKWHGKQLQFISTKKGYKKMSGEAGVKKWKHTTSMRNGRRTFFFFHCVFFKVDLSNYHHCSGDEECREALSNCS